MGSKGNTVRTTAANINTKTRPPGTYGIDDFSAAVGRAQLSSGEISAAWVRIDPRDAMLEPEYLRHRFAGALEIAAAACVNTVGLSQNLRTDLVYTLATIPGRRGEALPHINQLLREVPDADFASETFSDERCNQLFTRLSLMATYVHCRAANAREFLKGERLEQANELSRATLGGIVKKAVGQIVALSQVVDNEVDDETRKRARGRLFELMKFTYATAEWYAQPDPASMAVRFATNREDRPENDLALIYFTQPVTKNQKQ